MTMRGGSRAGRRNGRGLCITANWRRASRRDDLRNYRNETRLKRGQNVWPKPG